MNMNSDISPQVKNVRLGTPLSRVVEKPEGSSALQPTTESSKKYGVVGIYVKSLMPKMTYRNQSINQYIESLFIELKRGMGIS